MPSPTTFKRIGGSRHGSAVNPLPRWSETPDGSSIGALLSRYHQVHDHQLPLGPHGRRPRLRRPLTRLPAQADEVTLVDGITTLPVAEEIRDGYKRELYPHWNVER